MYPFAKGPYLILILEKSRNGKITLRNGGQQTDGRLSADPTTQSHKKIFDPSLIFFGLGAPSKIVSFGNHSQQVDITKY